MQLWRHSAHQCWHRIVFSGVNKSKSRRPLLSLTGLHVATWKQTRVQRVAYTLLRHIGWACVANWIVLKLNTGPGSPCSRTASFGWSECTTRSPSLPNRALVTCVASTGVPRLHSLANFPSSLSCCTICRSISCRSLCPGRMLPREDA
jgi:hypothetical protein